MNTCTRGLLHNHPRIRKVVLPWILFLGLAGAYIVVVTIGALSQLLRASLNSHYALYLPQGGTCSIDFEDLLYVRVQLETSDDLGGPIVLGFMDASTGEFVLNRTLSQGMPSRTHINNNNTTITTTLKSHSLHNTSNISL